VTPTERGMHDTRDRRLECDHRTGCFLAALISYKSTLKTQYQELLNLLRILDKAYQYPYGLLNI